MNPKTQADDKLNCCEDRDKEGKVDQLEVGACNLSGGACSEDPPSVRWRQRLVKSGLDLAETRIVRFLDRQRQLDEKTLLSTDHRNHSMLVAPLDRDVSQVPQNSDRVVDEGQSAIIKKPLIQPSPEERKRHNVTHIPYRSWCPVCVAARGRDDQHTSLDEDRERSIPEAHFDYCFLKNKVGEQPLTTLVLKERPSKVIFAYAVPEKGGAFTWIAQRIVSDLRRLGIYGDVTLRSDQESPLGTLMKQVASLRAASGVEHVGCKTKLENSKVKDSKGNGFIERGVQTVEGMIRSLKLDLEFRVGQEIGIDHVVLEWLVMHAGITYSLFQIGEDGKTPYERLKGKTFRGAFWEFVQPILFRTVGKLSGGVLQGRWHPVFGWV